AQTALDTENPHAAGSFVATGVRVSLKTGLLRTRTSDRNVVAYLPPRSSAPVKGEILIGAHYDHLGRGGDGSLAVQNEIGEIHNGADDNASGVAAVLHLAAALAAERKQNQNAFAHGVRFALWSGEEMGLLGSSRFAEKLDADTLDYAGLDRIAKFARGIALDLAATQEPPAYVQVAPQAATGGRETLRAYVGTIPDYAGEVEGLKLSGVRAGGPAEKGGLRGGDVIVSFAGQQVKNVYDYTFALDAVKIGVPIEVEVIRDGVRVKLQVTPEARK
ncbi:MAG TPA: M28 family peptidase, partial [Solirubrobacteraceae bacterium]